MCDSFSIFSLTCFPQPIDLFLPMNQKKNTDGVVPKHFFLSSIKIKKKSLEKRENYLSHLTGFPTVCW